MVGTRVTIARPKFALSRDMRPTRGHPERSLWLNVPCLLVPTLLSVAVGCSLEATSRQEVGEGSSTSCVACLFLLGVAAWFAVFGRRRLSGSTIVFGAIHGRQIGSSESKYCAAYSSPNRRNDCTLYTPCHTGLPLRPKSDKLLDRHTYRRSGRRKEDSSVRDVEPHASTPDMTLFHPRRGIPPPVAEAAKYGFVVDQASSP